jgi:hypothetical protein
MLMESLAYRNAREHIRAFAGESETLIQRHNEAMECRDCEAFLQMGIDAFQWLIRADMALREADADGEFSYTKEVDDSFKDLAKWWLRPCEFAERWINVQKDRGHELGNLVEFRRCCEEMRAIVHFNERDGRETIAPGLIPLRDNAVSESLNGETSEFIP